MKHTLYFMLSILGFCGTAGARIGETVGECEQRYGAAVTNYPGYGDLDSVRVHLKDEIYVIAFFTKGVGKEPRASMVIYSRLPPHVKGILLPPPEINAEEQSVLLGTVPGRWQTYDPTPALEGKPRKVIPLSVQSRTIKQRDATAEAVRKAVDAIYSVGLARFWASAPLGHVGCNGPKMFAFRVARGLAICPYEAADIIAAWADRVISERAKTEKPPAKKLTGF